jgi:hypothetical protein
VAIFGWYFPKAKTFGGIFLKSGTFNGTVLIFHILSVEQTLHGTLDK